MARKYVPILLILLVAFTLRAYRLTEVPPGLTHDEANHGRDSINVLDGVLLFYFPLNYGSEPLYNYVVAGNMALLGENGFALRLVNVFFGLLTIAATFRWAVSAFGRRTALVASALLAVSFWPLATSRQALRAGMLPFLTVMAVIFFWQMVSVNYVSVVPASGGSPQPESRRSILGDRRLWWSIAGFTICVTATLHTYLASRVLWLMFPIFLLYLAVVHRRLFRSTWLPTLIGLVVAGLLTIPMFAYVRAHPEAETRLQMLDQPLQNIAQLNLAPVLTNIREALLAFLWPGHGDHFLAYNIPGRPVLNGATAILFVFGLALCLWRWRRPTFAFLIIWFAAGIIPSLITGPEANTTRNLGALPAVYLLPAVGFVNLAQWTVAHLGRPARPLVAAILALWLFLVGASAFRDYFVRWGQAPDVRDAYQQTLVQALDYLEQNPTDRPTVMSTVYPGAAHDPSIARVLQRSGGDGLRWVDARYAVMLPAGQLEPRLIVPSSTPLHPAFLDLVRRREVVALSSQDPNSQLYLYELQSGALDWPTTPLNFGDAVSLLDARWLTDSVEPGQTAELLSVWQVMDPHKVGPVVPPAFETDAVLFTHVLDGQGGIMSQRDALDAPSWDWRAGDIIFQVHPVLLPPDTEPGLYKTVVGVYDRASGERLPLLDTDGAIVDTRAFVVPLAVHER